MTAGDYKGHTASKLIQLYPVSCCTLSSS